MCLRRSRPSSLGLTAPVAAVVGSFWAGLGALPRSGGFVRKWTQQRWQQLGGVPAIGRCLCMIIVYFVIVTRIRAAALGASVMHLMRLFPIRNRIGYYLRLGSLARGFPAGRPIAGPGSLQGPSAVDPTWASARNLAPGAIGPWWDKQGVLPESRVPQAVCRLAVPLALWGSGSLPPPIILPRSMQSAHSWLLLDRSLT